MRVFITDFAVWCVSALQNKTRSKNFKLGTMEAEAPRVPTSAALAQRVSSKSSEPKKPMAKVLLMGGAGAAAGIVSKTATAPLERVKMLLQVQAMATRTAKLAIDGGLGGTVVGGGQLQSLPAQPYSGIWGTLTRVVRTEGGKALFQGNGANCARIAPAYALRFAMNDKFKVMVARPGQNIGKLDVRQLALAGTLAGILQCVVTHPLETIRSRMSIGVSLGDTSARYSGIVDCGQKTVLKEGVAGLYKGFLPGLLAAGPYVGAQMTFYELFKRLTPVSAALDGDSQGSADKSTEAIAWRMLSGAAAGIAAQTLVFPGDTLRRRMQLNGQGGTTKVYSSVLDCVRKTWHTEGARGFYQGCGTNLVRAVPGVAIQFAVYDQLKAMI